MAPLIPLALLFGTAKTRVKDPKLTLRLGSYAKRIGVMKLLGAVVFASFGQGQNFLFGGTSILIMVGVGLDTVKQIESQLQQRNYEGFLR